MRATLAGLLDRLTPRPPGVRLSDDVRLDGCTALVTGASRGLGLAIATGLATRGARVLMACRSRADDAVAEVVAAAGHDRVEALPVDLAEPASVEALADALRDRDVSLDILVCNAGVVPARSRTTSSGLDVMVHVNFVANVQLVDRLLDDGTLAPRPGGRTPRVVVVGSEAHRSAPPVDLDTWADPVDYGTGGVMAHYGRSKLLLHTWAVELGRRLDGPDGPRIAVHHLCPGAIASNIAREAPAWSKPLLDLVMRLFFQSPETAARPALYLAASPELEGRTGVYLHLDQPKDPAAPATDADAGAALWDAAHDLVATLRG